MANRDTAIDTLRGMAIFTMVAANWAALILVEPHSFALRIYGSIAAPLFIFLAGIMVERTARNKLYTFQYFMHRGAYLMVVGAGIELLIFHIFPFLTIDVLYLIGLALPICFWFLRIPRLLKGLVVSVVLFAGPFLQNWLGYSAVPTEYYLTGQPVSEVPHLSPIWQQWLVDGWFPIFPWLGYALLGAWWGKENIYFQFSLKTGLILMIVGIGLLWFFQGPFYIRDGYSELFYPPTHGYVVISLGVIMLLFGCVKRFPNMFFPFLFGTLGKHSLWIYVFHLAVGEYVISRLWQGISIAPFLLVYAIGIVLLWGMCQGLELLSRRTTVKVSYLSPKMILSRRSFRSSSGRTASSRP